MRKIILYVSIVTLVVGVVYFLSLGQVQPSDTGDIRQDAPPSGPLAGRIIVVDPGHGGYDGGARAGVSRVWEKEINLKMAKAVAKALEGMGAKVILTRQEDKAFANKKRPDLDARLEMARQGNADMLLSIHMNQYHSAKESGPQVFYRQNHEASRLLAGAIQAAMIDVLQPKKQRKAMAGDYYMLSLDIPSVLVECGFLSNPEEEQLLMDAAYQQRMAQAVVQGVCQYYALQSMP